MRLSLLLIFLLFSCQQPVNKDETGVDLQISISSGYSVIYYSNGATEGDVPLDTNRYNLGDYITIKDGSSLSKNSSSLIRWNRSPEGTGKSYNFGDVIEAPGYNLELYGEW